VIGTRGSVVAGRNAFLFAARATQTSVVSFGRMRVFLRVIEAFIAIFLITS